MVRSGSIVAVPMYSGAARFDEGGGGEGGAALAAVAGIRSKTVTKTIGQIESLPEAIVLTVEIRPCPTGLGTGRGARP